MSFPAYDMKPGKASVVAVLAPPSAIRRHLDKLIVQRDLLADQHEKVEAELRTLRAYLDVSGRVSTALERLSKQLFAELLSTIEQKLTIALQEVLELPITFHARAEWKYGTASVNFWVERDGQREDIMKGQGGSVANILSIGLRMFALVTLDECRHRRFLVLDEQDCWLRPDLVPRLVKIVHDAGKALGFQVLMVSHHDVKSFEDYADKIYQFEPCPDGGVRVTAFPQASPEADA